MAETDIAVVGMACRLPGASDLAAFWRMLREGRDARRELTDDHLRQAGVPAELLADPDFVKAAMLLDDIDQFDAGFFGMSPRDAALFDPQHRVWLEVCWHAFEHAGHVPERFEGRIGVFAGCGMDTYLLHNVLTNPDLVRQIGMFLIRHTGNDKDFLATRTSYQFDLRGPSVNVLTACSTSLVAIHQASQSLLAGECDMALAGGVTILVPQDRGYLFKDGEVLSPDGFCRTFDADSKGTIFGSGAGVVVLRRLADALADGDRVHAVVKGSAVNNDGARKVSYLAPSVDGYAEVVAEALALADVQAEQVQYVEAHGTGTSVGDPIEIEALTQAFRATSSKTGYCGIGSVKTNIGHLDTAAGVAGLLKVVLAMQHGELPASLHYRRPNPLIDFPRSPFQVVAERRPWQRPVGGTRIAGVSSLGVGGTNAHLIVGDGEPQPAPTADYPRRCQLLPISGKSDDAATGNAAAIADWLEQHAADAEVDLADVAWTLQHGRRAFARRGFAVGADAHELATALRAGDWQAQIKRAADRAPSVVFLFPGGGAQHPGMARGLYEHEPAFRQAADECLAALPAASREAIRSLLFGVDAVPEHGERMARPSLMLPSLFLVEYALARTLMSFGIRPDAMMGHSLGEYVAGALGGTWDLAEVLPVLVLRGECLEQAPAGYVLSVSMAPAEFTALGDPELSLSAANAPELCAVAGTPGAIEVLESRLSARGVEFQRLRIGAGAHSHLLDPVLDRFRDGLRRHRPKPASTPWVSNVTGDWIDPQRAADPEYWVEHLRRTVRFQDGVATLLGGGDRLFVEVGPGKALTSLVRLHQHARKSPTVVSLPHPQDPQPADAFMLQAIGRMWQLGVDVDWRAFHGGIARRRVPLPGYAFQRQRHWIEPGSRLDLDGPAAAHDPTPPTRLPESEWLSQPTWRARPMPESVRPRADAVWLCVGGGEVATALARQVHAAGGRAVVVREAATPQLEGDEIAVPFVSATAWEQCVAAVTARHGRPTRVLFAAPLASGDASFLVATLLALWQGIGRADATRGLRLLAVTHGATSVAGESIEAPGQAAVAGFLRVVPKEFPEVHTRTIDVDAESLRALPELATALRCEVEKDVPQLLVALRSGARYVQELTVVPAPTEEPLPWRDGGVYLITGGLGGIGMLAAEHLARRCRARLVLVSRRGLPPRAVWDEWQALRAGDAVAGLIGRVRELERAGAEVEVVAADVTDEVAMARAVATAIARFGALHGVLHTAGVLDDGPIQTRRPEQVERVLAPKLRGAEVLDLVTAAAAPELFVVFASTSGLAGIPGQCDYAAANAALEVFAERRQQQRRGRSLAIAWGIWQDAGMLATAVGSEQAAPRWLGVEAERDGAIEFAANWAPSTHWVLQEHRIKNGDCVMPGTGHVELMLAAAQRVARSPQVTLRNVEFRTPLAFPGDAARTVFVSVRPQRDGFEVTVASALPGQTRDHERATHARAAVRVGGDGGARLDVAALRAAAATAAPASSDQSAHVAFGPRWQCIERVGVGDGVAFGELRLPESFVADLEDHHAHAAMLDMAFGCGIRLLSRGAPEALFVPVGCEQVVVHGRLPAEVVSSVRLRSYDERTRLGTLDVTVATPSGVVLVELRGLGLFGVRGQFGAAAGGVAVSRSATGNGHAPATSAVAQPVPRIRAILSRGITAPEGMLALERALQSGGARVVASSMDVTRVAAWLSLPPEPARRGPPSADTGARPVAGDGPRDEVEQKIAAAFGELLGVDRPGLDDDFFELGGHSLLAVRLFARIHKEFGLDLELSTLLSAGTVRKLAAALRAELSLPEPGSEPVRSVSLKKGQHVVPIQTAGTRPNLFLVHGAGGNVLGFRELSHYFGKDQPLWGLQARGVDGKQPPHRTIAEMADAYLAELREVQPHGPYFLGGYSGGGVIAYEMAQRLRAVGEPVPFVGMIDSWCPQLPRRSRIARTLLHVSRLARRGPMYPLRILRAKFERWSAARDTERARAEGGTLPQDKRGFEVQFAFEHAFVQHAVQPYEGDVWLFRAEDQQHGTRYIVDEALGWEPFVRGAFAIQPCPGNHFTMCTEPNVQVLCGHMMAAIDVVLARQG